ncbi:MAG: hypothetical protein ACLGSD_09735 [Acidobacteriota bacterium]
MQIPALLILGALAATTQAQTTSTLTTRPPTTTDDSPLSLLQSEEANGPSFYYTQHYRSNGREVLLNGTIYTAITGAQVKGCAIHLNTMLVDHFVGHNGRRKVPGTWNRYKTSLDFVLTPEIAAALRVIQGRPSQLDAATYPRCSERPRCTIEWLQITAPRADLKLRRITNDVADYDGYIQDKNGTVASFLVPLSSARTGEDLIARLRKTAATCGLTSPANP